MDRHGLTWIDWFSITMLYYPTCMIVVIATCQNIARHERFKADIPAARSVAFRSGNTPLLLFVTSSFQKWRFEFS